MQIDLLCNQKHFAKEIVYYLWNEWSEDYVAFTPYKSLDALYDFYINMTDQIPCAYIIFDENENKLIGVCIIDHEDMKVHPHLTPWLSSVYILPPYRKNGYATELLQYVLPKYEVLYLWTFTDKLADYYKQFGFESLEIIEKHGNHTNIILMKLVRRSAKISF